MQGVYAHLCSRVCVPYPSTSDVSKEPSPSLQARGEEYRGSPRNHGGPPRMFFRHLRSSPTPRPRNRHSHPPRSPVSCLFSAPLCSTHDVFREACLVVVVAAMERLTRGLPFFRLKRIPSALPSPVPIIACPRAIPSRTNAREEPIHRSMRPTDATLRLWFEKSLTIECTEGAYRSEVAHD